MVICCTELHKQLKISDTTLQLVVKNWNAHVVNIYVFSFVLFSVNYEVAP